MARFSNPIPGYYDLNGDPLSGGELSFFTVGTTTLKDIYTDVGLTTAAANPAVLDASGRLPDIYLDGSYRIQLKDQNGVLIFDRDNVSGDISTAAFADWKAEITYSTGDIVTGSDGCYYVSITDSNTGNDPTTTPANWTKFRLLREWNTNETYAAGDIVIGSDNELYKSLEASNAGNDPTTGNGDEWEKKTMDGLVNTAAHMYAVNNF